jgi:uncharacterized protein
MLLRMRKLTMIARHSQSLWVGVIIALNLLSSIALADSAVPAVPVDPEKLVAQAEKALDQEELDLAIKLYHQAAELNYIPAQVAMGEFADSAQFYEEAVGWFLMAATQGDAAGQYHLGRMYIAGTGIEKDGAKALYWIRHSADKKFLPAVKVLAEAYHAGGFSGLVKVDLDQAKSWDAKASRLEAIERKAADEKLAALVASRKKLQEEEAEKKANKK